MQPYRCVYYPSSMPYSEQSVKRIFKIRTLACNDQLKGVVQVGQLAEGKPSCEFFLCTLFSVDGVY
jgi:hypothetical protein